MYLADTFCGNITLVTHVLYNYWSNMTVKHFNKTDSKSMVDKIEQVFDKYCLPNKIMTENGSEFRSIKGVQEFV